METSQGSENRRGRKRGKFSDIEYIRDVLHPVPEKVLQGAEGKNEDVDFLKTEYRTIKKYEKYLTVQEKRQKKKPKKKQRPMTTIPSKRSRSRQRGVDKPQTAPGKSREKKKGDEFITHVTDKLDDIQQRKKKAYENITSELRSMRTKKIGTFFGHQKKKSPGGGRRKGKGKTKKFRTIKFVAPPPLDFTEKTTPLNETVKDLQLLMDFEFSDEEKLEVWDLLKDFKLRGFEDAFGGIRKRLTTGKIDLNLFFQQESDNELFKKCGNLGRSQFLQSDGTMAWKVVEILGKTGFNKYKIKFESGLVKEVGRINMIFAGESEEIFFRGMCASLIRRERRQLQVSQNLAISQVPTEDVSPLSDRRIDRIVKKIGMTFKVRSYPLIKKCLVDLEECYAYSFKKLVYLHQLRLDGKTVDPRGDSNSFYQRRLNREAPDLGEEQVRRALSSFSSEANLLELASPLRGTINFGNVSRFMRARNELESTYYFDNPVFHKILLQITFEIEKLSKFEIFVRDLDYPLEVFQFIELEKKQILMFLKHFRKEFFVRIINIIQRTITNDIYNFCKVDNLVKYHRSKMKKFVDLINFLLSTKIHGLVIEKIHDFMRFLSSTNLSFFKIKMISEKETQSITYSPTLENIVTYIEEDLVSFFIDELNKMNNITNEIFSSLNYEKKLFNFEKVTVRKFFEDTALSEIPKNILEQYSKYKEYCFDYNEKYIHRFIQLNLTPGTPVTSPRASPTPVKKKRHLKLIKLRNELLRLVALINGFDLNLEYYCRFVKIELTEIESLILNNLSTSKNSILKYMSDFCYDLNTNISESYKEIFNSLKKVPANPEELSSLKMYTASVKEKLISLLRSFKKVEMHMGILNEFQMSISDKEFRIYINTFEWPNKIEGLLSNSVEKIDNLKFTFIDSLKKEKVDLNVHITDFNNSICEIKTFSNLEYLEDYYRKISTFQKKIAEFKEQVKILNSREKLFAFPSISRFDALARIEKEYSEYFQLFHIIFEENTEYPKWNEGRLFNLVYREIKNKINRWMETLGKLSIKKLHLYDYIHKKLTKFVPNLKMIKYLLEPGLKLRHWNQILPSYQEFDNLKLIDLVDLNLLKKIDDIKSISLKARSEFRLENKIVHIEESLKKFKFDNVEIVVTNLNEFLVDLVKLRNDVSSKFFVQRMKVLESKIFDMIELLTLYKNFEKKFIFLRKIVKSSQNQQTFGNKINKNYILIEQNFNLLREKLQHLKNLDPVMIKKLKKSFKRFFRLIDEIDKNLAEFVENERRKFPRFHFLSTKTLIRNYNNLIFLLERLFNLKEGILIEDNCLYLLKGKLIIENISMKSVTHVLIEVEKKMKKILKKLLVCQRSRREDLPLQICYLRDSISFFKRIENVMEEQKFRGLQKLQSSFENSISDSEDHLLILNKLILKNLLEVLVRNEVQSRNEVMFRKQIRFYLKDDSVKKSEGEDGVDILDPDNPPKQSDGEDVKIFIKNLFHKFEYGFEYLGERFRLPFTRFSNFNAGMNLYANNSWFQNPSFDFLEEFANLLGKFLVVFNCADFTQEMIRNLMKGVIVKNALCGLMNLDPEIFRVMKELQYSYSKKKVFNLTTKSAIDFSKKDYKFGFFALSSNVADYGNDNRKKYANLYSSLFQDLHKEFDKANLFVFLTSNFLLMNFDRDFIPLLINKLMWIGDNVVKVDWVKFVDRLKQFKTKELAESMIPHVIMQYSIDPSDLEYIEHFFGKMKKIVLQEDGEEIPKEKFKSILESAECTVGGRKVTFHYRDEFYENFKIFLKYYRTHPIILSGPMNAGKSKFKTFINVFFNNSYSKYIVINEFEKLGKYLVKSGCILVIYKKMERFFLRSNVMVVGECKIDLLKVIKNNNIILIVQSESEKNYLSMGKMLTFTKTDVQYFLPPVVEGSNFGSREKEIIHDALVDITNQDIKFSIVENFKLLFTMTKNFLYSFLWSVGKLYSEKKFTRKFGDVVYPYVEEIEGLTLDNLFWFYFPGKSKKNEVKFFEYEDDKYDHVIDIFRKHKNIFVIDPNESFSPSKFLKKEHIKISKHDFEASVLSDSFLYFKRIIPSDKKIRMLTQKRNLLVINSKEIHPLKGFYYLYYDPPPKKKKFPGVVSSAMSLVEMELQQVLEPEELVKISSKDELQKEKIESVLADLRERSKFKLPKGNFLESFSLQEKIDYIQFEIDCFLLREEFNTRDEVLDGLKEILKEHEIEYSPALYLVSKEEEDAQIWRIDLETDREKITEYLMTKNNSLVFCDYIIKIIAQLTRIIFKKNDRSFVIEGISGKLLKKILKTCCRILKYEIIDFNGINSTDELQISPDDDNTTSDHFVLFNFNGDEHPKLKQKLVSKSLIYVNSKNIRLHTKDVCVHFKQIQNVSQLSVINPAEQVLFNSIFECLPEDGKNEILSIVRFYVTNKEEYITKYQNRINSYDEKIKNRLFIQHKIIKLKEQQQFINPNYIESNIVKEELYVKSLTNEKKDIENKIAEEEDRLKVIKMNVIQFDELKSLCKKIKKKEVLKKKHARLNKKYFGLFKRIFYKLDTRTSKNYHVKMDQLLQNYEFEDFEEHEKVIIKQDIEKLAFPDGGAGYPFRILKDVFLFALDNCDRNYDVTLLNELQNLVKEKNFEIEQKEETVKKMKLELEEAIEKLNHINFKIRKKERKLDNLRQLEFEKQKDNFEKVVKTKYVLFTCLYVTFLIRLKIRKRRPLIARIFGEKFEEIEGQLEDNLKFFLDYEKPTGQEVEFTNVNSILFTQMLKQGKGSIVVFGDGEKMKLGDKLKNVPCEDILNFGNLKKIIEKVKMDESEYVVLSSLKPKFVHLLRGQNYVFYTTRKHEYLKFFNYINDKHIDLREVFTEVIESKNMEQYRGHVKYFLSLHFIMKKFVSKINSFYSFTPEFYVDFFTNHFEQSMEDFNYQFYKSVVPVIEERDALLFSFIMAVHNFSYRKDLDPHELHLLLHGIVQGEMRSWKLPEKKTKENHVQAFLIKLHVDKTIATEDIRVFIVKELDERFLRMIARPLSKLPRENAIILNNNILDYSVYYGKYDNVKFHDFTKIIPQSKYLIEVFDNKVFEQYNLKKNAVYVLNDLKDLEEVEMVGFQKLTFHSKSFLLMLKDYFIHKNPTLMENRPEDEPRVEFLGNFLLFHQKFFGETKYFHRLKMSIDHIHSLFENFKNLDEIFLFRMLLINNYCVEARDVDMYTSHFLEPIVMEREHPDFQANLHAYQDERTKTEIKDFKPKLLRRVLEFAEKKEIPLTLVQFKARTISKKSIEERDLGNLLVLQNVYLMNANYEKKYMRETNTKVNLIENKVFVFEFKEKLDFDQEEDDKPLLERIESASDMAAFGDGKDLEYFECNLFQHIGKKEFLCTLKLKSNKESEFWLRKDVYACLSLKEI